MSRERRDQAAVLPEGLKSRENLVVLYLTQAMLGLVSSNMRAVAVDVKHDRLVVHFAVGEDTPEIRDDVEDILGDLDALLANENLPDDWLIESAIYRGGADADWPGRAFRRIYEAKPDLTL
jgi:hypothetical protein